MTEQSHFPYHEIDRFGGGYIEGRSEERSEERVQAYWDYIASVQWGIDMRIEFWTGLYKVYQVTDSSLARDRFFAPETRCALTVLALESMYDLPYAERYGW